MPFVENENEKNASVSAAKPPTKPEIGKKRPRTNPDAVKKPEIELSIDSSSAVFDYAQLDTNLGDEEREQYREILEAMMRFSQRGSVDIEDGEQGNVQMISDTINSKRDSQVDDSQHSNGNPKKGQAESRSNGTTEPKKKKSRRQRKEEARGNIALLKAMAARPDVVDAWDVTAADPLLLVALKSWPNSVPVPGNWRQKRKYLQNKRGMEKRTFVLPSYIANTGVGALRDAQIENDSKKTLKQKAREKMRAKTGRGVEIDEVVARDAFFKFQTKPRLTGHGDLYYELRELEVDSSRFRPGIISSALRAALGIGQDDPPPWLINMQRFGPPPGYPGLKIPGLNAPIPRGAMFGYQVGGWGKPPVDMNGRPIYGDVFGEGLEYQTVDFRFDVDPEEKKMVWGEIKEDDRFVIDVPERVTKRKENEQASDIPKSNSDDKAVPANDDPPPTIPPPPPQAPAAPSTGTASVQIPTIEVPASGMELRKGVPEGELYTVLQEKKRSVGKSEVYGSAHGYVIPGHETLPSGTVNENVGLEVEERKERKRKEVGKEGGSGKRRKSFKF